MQADTRAISFTYFGVRFVQTWYDEELVPPLPDIAIRRYSLQRPASGHVWTKRTIVNDLSAPEDEIFAGFGKNCRYKIKRAESKDLALCTFTPSPGAAEIDAFIDYYADFARQKRLAPISRRRFLAIADAGRLRLSHAELAGQVMARHAYVVYGERVNAFFGASHFRTADPELRAAIGRSNRLLNWRDMLAFKAAGIRYFDWAGMFEDESTAERKGINDFKREFGGVEVDCFEGYEGHSRLGRLIVGALPVAQAAWGMLQRLRG